MFQQTSTRQTEPGVTVNIYRDRDASPRIAVTHMSAHRGGCLYLGTVTILNQDTGRSFVFTSTAAPYELGADGAAAYAKRHADKVA